MEQKISTGLLPLNIWFVYFFFTCTSKKASSKWTFLQLAHLDLVFFQGVSKQTTPASSSSKGVSNMLANSHRLPRASSIRLTCQFDPLKFLRPKSINLTKSSLIFLFTYIELFPLRRFSSIHRFLQGWTILLVSLSRALSRTSWASFLPFHVASIISDLA